MSRRLLAVLFVVSCHTIPSPAPLPDASDAAAEGLAPDPCTAACAALQRAGCHVLEDCRTVLLQATTARLLRGAKGQAVICQDLAAVRSVTDVQDLGLGCTP